MNIQDDAQAMADLKRAAALLEKPSITIQIADVVGAPVEWGLKKLPAGAQYRIQGVVKAALQKAVDGALLTMTDRSTQEASTVAHKFGAAMTGLAGGFFGLPGTLVEIPVTTTLMMRSVADIARSEGFDVSDPVVQSACIEVFALGGRSKRDDAAESAYYAVRLGMADVARRTAAELGKMAAERGARQFSAKEVSQALARLIEAVATRFGIVITEKAAAQIVPVVGAVAAATINTLFTNHFQDMARGHFVVRRLEGQFGEAQVQAAYEGYRKLL